MIGLVLALFSFLLLLSLFAFDTVRAQMAQREIVALCDAASLAGTSMLATYDTSSPAPIGTSLTNAQYGASLYSYNLVRRGSLLGQTLMKTTQAANATDLGKLSAGESKFLYTLVDPTNNYSPVPLGDAKGKACKVEVAYGYQPQFFQTLGIGMHVLKAHAVGGLPQVDAVLVFDYSGSMDDSTKVSFVCRSWDDTTNKIKYQVVAPTSGDSTMSNILSWNYGSKPAGTNLNVLPPQSLQSSNDPPATGKPLLFIPFLRVNPQGNKKEYGTPPGDCTMAYPTGFGAPGTPQPHPPAANSDQYTDLIVNIANPGSAPYQQPLNGPNNPTSVYPLTVKFSTNSTYEPDPLLRGQTFTFPSLAATIEAARGNLDSLANYNGALLYRGNTNNWAYPPSSQIGRPWQRAYMRLAMLHTQPLATALDGAYEGFFKKMNGLTDARYGLVGFSGSSGLNYPADSSNLNAQTKTEDFRAPYSTWSAPNVGSWWYNTSTASPGAAGYGNSSNSNPGFKIPRVALNHSLSQSTSFNNCTNQNYFNVASTANGLFAGRPMGQTDTAEALSAAVKMFNNPATYDIATLPESRKASRKVIIFFTDGQPTGGIGSTEANNTKSVAANCASQGIAIFTIGLNVTGNGTLSANQETFLGESTGLAKLGSNGGKFFPVSDAASVKKAFTAVARRLVQNQ
jgi:hypothetical protein